MVRTKIPVLLLALALSSPGLASPPYGRVCAQVLKQWIFEKKRVLIVDTQSPEEFAEHNYEGSVPAGDAKEKLTALARANSSNDLTVVVVSETGGEAAVRAASILESNGIGAPRLLILEAGMEGALSGLDTCCGAGGGAKPR